MSELPPALDRLCGWFNRKPPVTHDVMLDGVGACVSRVEDGGKRITVYGWRDDHWRFEQGHLIRLLKKTPDGLAPSTYRILKDRHCGDPPDMYFLDCEYVGATS